MIQLVDWHGYTPGIFVFMVKTTLPGIPMPINPFNC